MKKLFNSKRSDTVDSCKPAIKLDKTRNGILSKNLLLVYTLQSTETIIKLGENLFDNQYLGVLIHRFFTADVNIHFLNFM